MEYKSVHSFTKEIDDRTVTGITAIFGNIDEGADRIKKGAFKKTIAERAERIRHLWQHNTTQPPTAAIKELREVGKAELPKALKEKHPEAKGGLLVKREYLDTPRGNEVLAGIKSGALNEMSFGFDPVKFDFESIEEGDQKGLLIRNLLEIRLWDTSDVNWGMNPATVASKAIPFRDTGKTNEGKWHEPNLVDFLETDKIWDDLPDAEKQRIAAHFSMTENTPVQSFEDLKLPHHVPQTEGVGAVHKDGVVTAMQSLLNGKANRAIYNHIAKHYEQFKLSPPDFKLIELGTALSNAVNVEVSQYRKNHKYLSELFSSLDRLNEILREAEPTQSLTSEGMVVQFDTAQAELDLLGV